MSAAESSVSQQDLLKSACTSAQEGQLPAWEEAKAWALREVWRKDKESDWGMQVFVAGRVYKSTGTNGKQKPENPTPSAIHQLFARMDADPQWFPGKAAEKQNGPAPVLKGVKRRLVAEAADDQEPGAAPG